MAEYFLWFKAAHIVMVVAWMAALFYLPRLFVYHAMAPVGGAVSEQLKVMERRLANGIMLPAAIGSWLFGTLLVVSGGYEPDLPRWLWLKLGFVVALSLLQVLLHKYVADFAADRRVHGDRYFRVLNEVPTLALIAIVLAVVLKPAL